MENIIEDKYSIRFKGEWDQQGIIDCQQYLVILVMMIQKINKFYHVSDAKIPFIQKDSSTQINNISFDDWIRSILELEENILSLFKTHDNSKYEIFWKKSFETYYNRNTYTVTPRITILWIDSYISDKYSEIMHEKEDSEKILQSYRSIFESILRQYNSNIETDETAKYIKVIKVYLLL